MRPEVRRSGGVTCLALADLVFERVLVLRFVRDVCQIGWNRSGARRLVRAVRMLVWVGRNTSVCFIVPNGAEAFWCLVALFEPLSPAPLLSPFSPDLSFSVDFE